MLTRMYYVTISNIHVMKRQPISEETKKESVKFFLRLVSLNLIAPIGLGLTLTLGGINFYDIKHTATALCWVSIFEFLSCFIEIGMIAGLFYYIKKTRAQLLEFWGNKDVMDNSVFMHAVAMVVAVLAQLLTNCAMFVLEIKEISEKATIKGAQITLIMMTVSLLLNAFQQVYLIQIYIKKIAFASYELSPQKLEADTYDTEFDDNTRVEDVLLFKEREHADTLQSATYNSSANPLTGRGQTEANSYE